jgi:catechol 2,3-dioxygenase-like lactoylglutathione lyase family enzyme
MLGDFPVYASVPAHDLERARRWYNERLGLNPIVELGSTLVYNSGSALFQIYETPSAGTGKHTIAIWVVEDLDATMQELRSRGVEFEDYALGDAGPNTIEGVQRDAGGGAAAWFSDSEGNVLSIVRMPPGLLPT